MPFKNKEKKKEYQEQYRREHPQQRLAADKKYRQVHREEISKCQRQLYWQHREERLERNQRYRQKNRIKERERHRQYYHTIKGYLAVIFKGIKQRCNNPRRKDFEDYGGRGIKCLFASLNDFRSYVINALKVDPRGLRVHRIDNCGNYEKGNIEFLTPGEHGLKHRKRNAKTP